MTWYGFFCILQEVHMEKLHLFSNYTSAPRPKLCYNDTNHCDLLVICMWLPIFLLLVINCLKCYWLLICWNPHPDPHFDHLAWGRVSWSLCLSCICLLAMHTLICVAFSLPPGVGGWLRLLLVALSRLFCLPFNTKMINTSWKKI